MSMLDVLLSLSPAVANFPRYSYFAIQYTLFLFFMTILTIEFSIHTAWCVSPLALLIRIVLIYFWDKI